MGKRIVNSPWMKTHKVVDLVTKTNGDKVLFRYGNYMNAFGFFNHRYVTLDLSIYGYHGGELIVKPVIEGQNYAKDFNVYLNDNWITTIHGDANKHIFDELYLPKY